MDNKINKMSYTEALASFTGSPSEAWSLALRLALGYCRREYRRQTNNGRAVVESMERDVAEVAREIARGELTISGSLGGRAVLTACEEILSGSRDVLAIWEAIDSTVKPESPILASLDGIIDRQEAYADIEGDLLAQIEPETEPETEPEPVGAVGCISTVTARDVAEWLGRPLALDVVDRYGVGVLGAIAERATTHRLPSDRQARARLRNAILYINRKMSNN